MISSTVYIETYGCQMNKLDSENVSSILKSDGFTIVSEISDADIILLNTCGVRENAEQRIYGRVGELSAYKKDKPELLFGIIGCMAQRLGDELLSKNVRIVAGPDSYRKLPDMIKRATYEEVIDINLVKEELYEDITPIRTSPFSAWVAIMRGCNNFCSYCIVPYTRGRERSIPHKIIINEINALVEAGYKEVTLLGQNVNSYCDNDVDFAGLLERVSSTGIEWIRFMTSHPKDLTDDILHVIAENKNICNHLHLPLQSGSDSILKAMNRGYTVSDYLGLIERTRDIVGNISITTDLIFGFPGETEQDYRATISVMETVRFDFAFLYRYSERAGTAACGLPGSVPEETRLDRLGHAIDIQNATTREKNAGYIGSVMSVLVKSRSKDEKGWFGFSEFNIPVVFYTDNGNVKPGSIVKVLIESTTGASIVGKHIVSEPVIK
ncbi:tRNA (N6-isopentenyl adenosine(37)-C2)-methylthiotransferase MiaB [Candidatus Latescibacterota bacterium]